MAGTVNARTLREWLNDGSEIAVLDVRDGGPYSRGHILVASGVPRAVLETAIPRLLPRRSVRVVLTDEDGSTLGGAAALMESAGYSGVHLLEGGNAATIACSIIGLAHNLGLTVLAEGVETEGQQAFLAEQGCDAYQGYLFGRPEPLAELESRVRGLLV